MAYRNKEISNPISGQRIRFLQTREDTDGRLLEMESHFAPNSVEPVPHYHPFQDEFFVVEEGSISIRVNRQVKVLNKGEQFHIPAKTVHSTWNHSGKNAMVNWKVQPAMETEYFLETGMGLATEGKVNEKGMPALLQSILLLQRYKKVYRLARPPYFIQKILTTVLAPIAKIKGYRSGYQHYVD